MALGVGLHFWFEDGGRESNKFYLLSCASRSASAAYRHQDRLQVHLQRRKGNSGQRSPWFCARPSLCFLHTFVSPRRRALSHVPLLHFCFLPPPFFALFFSLSFPRCFILFLVLTLLFCLVAAFFAPVFYFRVLLVVKVSCDCTTRSNHINS